MVNGQMHVSPPMPASGYRHLRHWVHKWMAKHPVADVDPDDVALALIELVSSSLRHGTGEVDIELTADGTTLVIEVGETSAVQPPPRVSDAQDVGGRGLAIVAGLSRAWGVLHRPDGGKIVWCDFSSSPLGGGAGPD